MNTGRERKGYMKECSPALVGGFTLARGSGFNNGLIFEESA
jgi:hypothetical protein